MQQTENKTLIINSAYRRKPNETPGNFSVELANNFKIRKMKFRSLTMPFAVYAYQVNGVDNILYMVFDAVLYSIAIGYPEIGEGSSGSAVAKNIQKYIRAAISDATFNVVYDSTTLLFNFNHPSKPFILKFSLAAPTNNLFNILGFYRFTDASSTIAVSPVVGFEIWPPHISKVNGYDFLYIVSPELTAQKAIFNTGPVGSSDNGFINPSSNVLLTVPCFVSFGTVLTLLGGSYPFEQNMRDITLQTIHISIVDVYGNPLQMDGDWNMEFDLETVLF